jgi:putative ABC transport system permease protein
VNLRGVSTIDALPTIRAELAKNAQVLGAAEAEAMPGDPMPTNVMELDDNAGALHTAQFQHMPMGEDFARVLGLKILQGRDFSKHLLTDVGSNWIVNETLVRQMGWTEPLGKRIQFGQQSGRVIGVVQDFNFKSLHSPMEPFAMSPLVDDFSGTPEAFKVFQRRLLVLDISGSDVGRTLDYVEKIMAKVDPKHPFEYTFLDDALDKAYKSERQLMRLIGVFAAVCIFIACLGLFGLSAFTTEQRTREIAMRKVLGATTWQIITLLARGILALVIVAAVLATAIAYFGIDEWLTGFAYRARINPLIFLIASAGSAVVAFLTVALQSRRTASANPVEGLRHVQ